MTELETSQDAGHFDDFRPLLDKKVLLIVTGGIAAYKAAHFVRLLRKAGAHVKVVMTESACEFVTPLTFATLSGNEVLSDMFPSRSPAEPIHLSTAEWADVLVVAPATANFIAKVAHGIADDLASSIVLGCENDILFAPAMNPRMWNNPATAANVSTLKDRGYYLIGPECGEMAGINEKDGFGRMSEPVKILAHIERHTCKSDFWKGRKVLITAGPTREKIDPVRYLSNYSSGKMGSLIAKAAWQLGAEVKLIRGKGTATTVPDEIEHIPVDSTDEMSSAVKAHFIDTNVLIMAAAVSDWTIKNPAGSKIKKTAGKPALEFDETEDILAWAGNNRTNQFVAGFALETADHTKNAEKKLKDKNVDMIVLNDASREHSAFGGDTTQLTIISTASTLVELPISSKHVAAIRLLKQIEKHIKSK